MSAGFGFLVLLLHIPEEIFVGINDFLFVPNVVLPLLAGDAVHPVLGHIVVGDLVAVMGTDVFLVVPVPPAVEHLVVRVVPDT